MIPVSEWYSRQRNQGAARLAGLAEQPAAIEPAAADPVADAYERGRADGLAEGAGAAALAHAAEITQWQARLSDCERLWSSRLSSQMTEDIVMAVESALQRLESAVAAVLTPFLEEQVRIAASARLRELALQEIARHGSQLIEVRAPVELHEPLREALCDRGLSTAIAADDAVRIVSRDGTAVFDSMAGRWIALLRGEAR